MKVRIRVSATITQEYDLDEEFFLGKSFGSVEEMIEEQRKYLEEDMTSLWESGELSDLKVERIPDVG